MGVVDTGHNTTNMNPLYILIALASVSSGLPQGVRSQQNTFVSPPVEVVEPLGLSSGAFEILGPNARSRISFSCAGRIYGYYANEDLNCQVFHVCEPVTYDDAIQEMRQYNFFCPNQTVFDQSLLACTWAIDAIPCSESSAFQFRNEDFGIIPEGRTGLGQRKR